MDAAVIETTLLKILVTVTVLGKPPVSELLHKEYGTSNGWAACHRAAQAIVDHAKVKKGVTVTAKCVPAPTRGV